MSIFTIMEFADMPIIPGAMGNPVPVGVFNAKSILQPVLTLGTASTASAAFAATTNFIRIHNSAICNFKVGPAGTTASTQGAGRLPAEHVEYLGVQPGQIIAVIADS